MRIVIPFKKENAKSRLSGVLTPDERDRLAIAMLYDVLDATDGRSISSRHQSSTTRASIRTSCGADQD